MPKISIEVACLLPKRNNGQYYEQAFNSLIMQKSPYSNILVCENHSTDGSQELPYRLAEGLEKVTVFTPDRPASTEEYCLALLDNLPSSDFYHFASSDDIWSPNFLKTMKSAIRAAGPNVTAAFCDTVHFDNKGLIAVTGNVKVPRVLTQPIALRYFMQGCAFYQSSALFRADIVQSFRGHPPSTGPVIDWAMMIEAARHGNILYICKPLFHHRIHHGSTSNSSEHKSRNLLDCLWPYLEFAGLADDYRLISDGPANGKSKVSVLRSSELPPLLMLAAHKLKVLNVLRRLKGLDRVKRSSNISR